MALHQYIGARYVPKFYENSLDPSSCEWESNVTYEPLTLVTLTNLHCYISKKTVPASIGTPADNSDYWLETGNFNAYIADLQNQVDAINLELSTNDLEALNRDLKSVIESGRADIVAIGDSWAVSGGWSDALETMIKCHSFTKISQGGIGFSSDAFKNKLVTYASGLTTEQKEAVDLIIQSCSINDYGTTYATLQTNVRDYLTYATTTFPNAKIVIVSLNRWFTGTIRREAYTSAPQSVICEYKNVYFMDVRDSYDWNDFTNGAHLTTDGYKKVATGIMSKMMGGDSATYSDFNTMPMYFYDINENNVSTAKQWTGEVIRGVAYLNLPAYEVKTFNQTISLVNNIDLNFTGLNGYPNETAMTGLKFDTNILLRFSDNTTKLIVANAEVTGNGKIRYHFIADTDFRNKTLTEIYFDTKMITVDVAM